MFLKIKFCHDDLRKFLIDINGVNRGQACILVLLHNTIIEPLSHDTDTRGLYIEEICNYASLTPAFIKNPSQPRYPAGHPHNHQDH